MDPANGGRLSSLAIGGHELLVTADDGADRGPFFWGSFPMAPWVGRVHDAAFTYEGETHRLPVNAPPHAMHGTVLDTAWTRIDDHTIEADLGAAWPFGGFARQHFALSDHDLVQTLELHAADRPMPASIGWHPWFRWEADGARLELGVDTADTAAWTEMGERLDSVPPRPWDHYFSPVRWPVRLRWPGVAELAVSSDQPHAVIYTGHHLGACVEPVTDIPNSLNTGPRVVEPGEPLVATMRISWRTDG